ncbi:MAG: ABC transporter ATP-binding protein [Candidatus Atelocyanobacterium sp. ALOHA_A2.5_9]|nr:ABC transporter ATP-binding protein [Candidatus Atelocyanobacterium sp. ALOHA_A2.5_9]
MSEIKLNSLVKNFGGNSLAVDNLSVTFPSGEFVCLLGPSGCGKTTTLRMIAGLERPDSGEIFCGDQTYFSSNTGEYLKTEKRNLGLMFQSYALWPHMTVFQNIVFGLDMKNQSSSEKEKRFEELEKLFQLKNLKNRYPSELSGGQQQRVALARMLAVNPNLLLLDEPLSNLDSNLRLEMRAELKRLHQTLGCTIIFVTHDQMEAMTLATSIAVMNKGVIEQLAKPMEIYKNPKSLFVAKFVGSPQMNTVDFNDGEQLALSLLSKTKFEKNNVKTLGIRPESIKLTSKDNGDINGKIETIQPTGADWIVGLNISGKSIFAISSDQPPGNENDTIGLSFKLDGLHAFDRNDLKLDVD